MARLLQLSCLNCFFTLFKYSAVEGFGMNLMKVDGEDRSQIACTVGLLRKYFHSGETLSGSLLSVSMSSASLAIQQNLMRGIHNCDESWSIMVHNGNQDYPSTTEGYNASEQAVVNEKPQCYFIVIENLENDDLESIFDDWKLTINWNPLAQFVVLLASVEESDEEMTELMIEILLSFLNKKIFNVNVIGQNEENGYFYGKTVFPYHSDNNCGNRVITIETLDICDYQDRKEADANYDDLDESEEDETTEESDSSDTNTESYELIQEYRRNVKRSINNKRQLNKLQMTDAGAFVNTSAEIDTNTDDENSEYKDENNTEENTDDDDDDDYHDGNETVKTEKKPSGTNGNGGEVKVYMEELYRALFLDKFPQDLSGCSLTAAFRPWEPYIFNEVSDDESDESIEDATEVYSELDNVEINEIDATYNSYDAPDNSSDDPSKKMQLNGIEYMMVKTIGERLHMNIEMRIENKNLYHLFQLLMDGDIEMIIGGIDEDPSISQYVSSTIPYHQDDLTWCVAKAKRHHSLFNFLKSFEIGTWVLTIAFILATAVQILLIQRFLKIKTWSMRSFTAACLRVMGIVLSQSIQLNRTTLALKITFFTAFFMGLMFSNVYQSFLVSTLTTPQSLNQIKHLMDLYKYHLSVMGSVDNVRHISKEDEIYKYIRENFQMCYNIEECLQRAAQDEKIAVAVSRQHSYYNPRIPRDHLYCFDRNENLYVYLVTMLLPKKFHLLHKINPIIQHIIESGHMQKWARDLDIKRKIRDEMKKVREDAFRSLTLVQVAGGFAFSGVLLVYATLIFFLELWTYKAVVKRRTRVKIFRRLHIKFQYV